MRRRVIEVIITEDWLPQEEGLFPASSPCSTVAYKFEHNGEHYGSYVNINRANLNDDEVVEAVSVIIAAALDAFEVLAASERANKGEA